MGKAKEAKPGKWHDDDQKALRQVVSQEIRDDRSKKREIKRSHVEHFKRGNCNRYFVIEKVITLRQSCETTEASKIFKRQILKKRHPVLLLARQKMKNYSHLGRKG